MWALENEHTQAPLSHTRAFDAGLSQRVARGLAGVLEARQIDYLVAWLDRYEMALAWVAEHGSDDAAMLASRVLAGDWDDAWLKVWSDGRKCKATAAARPGPQGRSAAGHG